MQNGTRFNLYSEVSQRNTQFHKQKQGKRINVKAKESIPVEWNKKYELSNTFFWKFHRNQRLKEIYILELGKEKPNLLKKFLPNFNITELK